MVINASFISRFFSVIVLYLFSEKSKQDKNLWHCINYHSNKWESNERSRQTHSNYFKSAAFHRDWIRPTELPEPASGNVTMLLMVATMDSIGMLKCTGFPGLNQFKNRLPDSGRFRITSAYKTEAKRSSRTAID